jgi:hypothetical protein
VRELPGSENSDYYFLKDAYAETGHDQLLGYSLVGLGSRDLYHVGFGAVRPVSLNLLHVAPRWT